GGIVSELYGAEDPMKTGNVLAANPRLHALLEPLLRGAETRGQGSGIREKQNPLAPGP
ncbi:MAG: hypothetical protein HYZ32_04450, partial [Hydrocarboniphaga effusa]|nr:hypothetical protein [Hydrocarboniphaga effusa]